jgi:hypothetical protein
MPADFSPCFSRGVVSSLINAVAIGHEAHSFLLIDHQGDNLFFELISRRYEKGAIILTSDQSLGAWGELFGDLS